MARRKRKKKESRYVRPNRRCRHCQKESDRRLINKCPVCKEFLCGRCKGKMCGGARCPVG